MNRYAILSVAIAGLFFAPLIVAVWPSEGMRTRDLGCSKVTSPRAAAICQSVSASMKWTWLGHAIIAPGWRVEWSSLRRAYCESNIASADIPELEKLESTRDPRLQNAAENLIQLLRPEKEDPSSIFHPGNPEYLLKQKCP